MGSPRIQVHPQAEVDPDVQIGEGTVIWRFTHIMMGTRIGKVCMLGQGVFVGRNVRIGDYCRIQNYACLYEGTVLEEEVFIGPAALLLNDRYPRVRRIRPDFRPEGVYVERGASIGARVCVLGGVRIGRYAMVGAGSVVTRNVLPYEMVVGNPARHAGWVSRMGAPLRFDTSGIATCPLSGEIYRFDPGKGRIFPQEKKPE